MSNHDAGRRIRSQDLSRRNQEARERFDAAEQGVQKALERAQMASLALQASPPSRPTETAPGDRHVLYREPAGSAGTSHVGPFVAPTPTGRSKLLRAGEIAGTGELELLRPGGLWARTHANRSHTYEARLQPERRLQVDSIMIPHVAGSVDVTLKSPRTDFEVTNVTESQLLRFDRPRALNGRVVVTSRSTATRDGDYIHTLGGIELYAADWAAEGEIRVPFQSPAAGSITAADARLRPGGESPTHNLYRNGSQVSLPLSVAEGDPLELRFPVVDGTTAASLTRITLTIE